MAVAAAAIAATMVIIMDAAAAVAAAAVAAAATKLVPILPPGPGNLVSPTRLPGPFLLLVLPSPDPVFLNKKSDH